MCARRSGFRRHAKPQKRRAVPSGGHDSGAGPPVRADGAPVYGLLRSAAGGAVPGKVDVPPAGDSPAGEAHGCAGSAGLGSGSAGFLTMDCWRLNEKLWRLEVPPCLPALRVTVQYGRTPACLREVCNPTPALFSSQLPSGGSASPCLLGPEQALLQPTHRCKLTFIEKVRPVIPKDVFHVFSFFLSSVHVA